MASHITKGKSVGLLKQAWNEIPDIVAGSVLALFSIVGVFGVYHYKKSIGEVEVKRYKYEYTVVRPDDPLAKYAPPKES